VKDGGNVSPPWVRIFRMKFSIYVVGYDNAIAVLRAKYPIHHGIAGLLEFGILSREGY